MRLGILTDRNAARDGNGLWIGQADGRLFAALRDRCAAVTLALSMAPTRTAAHGFNLSDCAIEILERPYIPSIASGFFHVIAAKRLVRRLEQDCDVVLVQMPFAAVTALFHPQKPRVYQLCANVRTMVAHSPYYVGARRAAGLAITRYFDFCHRRLVRDPQSRFVAHGDELLEQYGAEYGRSIVSSSIEEHEILSVRRSRAANAPFRVLFVGFLRHEKGVDVLLNAFERVLTTIPDAELEIVGTKDLSEHGVSAQIREATERLGQRATVLLRGHLDLGPRLFEAYANADVCVVPSRSEGTPRVLIEARAFGCPVVAGKVGGIPTSIEHERDGLLVPPDDAEALAAAILRIAGDRPLRDRMISQGIERARRTTVEDFADAIIAEANVVLKRAERVA